MNQARNGTSNGQPGEPVHTPSGVYWALLNSLSTADRQQVRDAIARHVSPIPSAATPLLPTARRGP
ncbi:MAG: hypothetical protein QOE24_775 [Frankiales bacterium]|nr:hypothetical protein [Frankiales bacterium]